MDVNKRGLLTALALAAATGANGAEADAPADPVPFAIWAAVNAATQGYADCLDRFDMSGLAALFSPDCIYDYAPGLTMQGRAEVEAGARKSLANVIRSSHMVGPPVVGLGEAAGTFASRVYFIAYHEQKDGGRHTVQGRYVDLFRSDASGRLLIARRKTLSHTAEGISTPRYWLPRQPS